MKILRLVILISLLVIVCGWQGGTAAPRRGEISVYLMPHQDDEMFMAGSMEQDILDGKRVYAVLVTDGSASAVRYIINGEDKLDRPRWSAYDRKVLRPEREGYEPLSTSTFSAARDREFVSSMRRLGLPESNIFIGYTNYLVATDTVYKDSSLKAYQAKNLIETLEKVIGVGTYNTLYPDYRRQHPDHHALGLGLEFANIYSKKRFFFEHPVPRLGVVLSPASRLAKWISLGSYFIWDPEQGRFAIGAHSVENRLLFWRRYGFEFATPN